MRKIALALALLALGALSARAQAPAGPVPGPGAFGNVPFVATGGTTPISPADRAAWVLNVMDHGAKCDYLTNPGSPTDDTAAINATIAVARAANKAFEIYTPGQRVCYHTGTINATALKIFGSRMNLRLHCANAGGICVDGLSTRWLTWDKLYIQGDCTSEAAIGVQFGRISGASADLNQFDRPNVVGCFSVAAFGNFASENTQVVNPYFENDDTTHQTYTVAYDASNDFNWKSAFVTQTVAPGTMESFNGNQIVGGQVYCKTGATLCTPFYLSGLRVPSLIGTYAASFGNNCFHLAQDFNSGGSPTTQPNAYLDFTGVHCETTPVVDEFLITGAQAAQTLQGLRLTDHNPQATNSIFKADTAVTTTQSGAVTGGNTLTVTSATGLRSGMLIQDTTTPSAIPASTYIIVNGTTVTTSANVTSANGDTLQFGATVASINARDMDVAVGSFGGGSGVKVFDNAALWTVDGRVSIPAITNWPAVPAAGSYSLCVATTCYSSAAKEVVNRNPDMVLDQAHEGNVSAATNANPAVDGWGLRNVGGMANGVINTQRNSSLPPVGYTYSLQLTVSTPTSPTSSQGYSFRSMVEAPNLSGLGWGAAGAAPIAVDFWLKANNTGNYPVSINTGVSGNSYVLDNNVTAVSTWQHFAYLIPGPTSGTFATTPNQVGFFVSFGMCEGSTFQTTPGAWQSGEFFGTASSANFCNISGGQLNVGAVHVYTLPIVPNYLPRLYDRELALAKRFYDKSFKVGQAVGQNNAGVGAVTFTAPYAGGTLGTAGTAVRFARTMFNNTGGTSFPTITYYSTGAATANCYDLTKTTDTGAPTTVNEGDAGFFVSCPLTGGTTAALGDQIQFQWSAWSAF